MRQLKVRHKHGHWPALWSCQTAMMANNTEAVIHRDRNAARNMRLLATNALCGLERPAPFDREKVRKEKEEAKKEEQQGMEEGHESIEVGGSAER